jgi:hypothetical protein
MDAVTGQDQDALQAQLAEARERLEALVRDLRAIDRELEGLTTDRRQHRLLHDVCGALEELGELGGAALFWGSPTSALTGEDQIRRVRGLVDVFQKRVDEIEDRREAVLETIQRQEHESELLDYELFEAQEEQRRLDEEWIVEREISAPPPREMIMPWTRGGEDDERFRKSLATSLLTSLVLALLVAMIELPLRGPDETVEVPERVVRLMMEARPLPPRVREEARPQPQEKLAQEKPEQALPQAPPKPRTEGPGKGSGEGPETGPGKGLLAFREKLAGAVEVQAIARLGSQARISGSGDASGPPQRSMLTTQAPGSSGGINLAAISRGLGGGGGGGGSLAGVQVARATSTIAGGGGRSDRPHAGSGAALSRTDEEIQIVFDRHKAELYRLYNRELRRDPTLRGQMILHLRIEPDGSVSLCELQGTDMNAPQLAAQVVDRVKAFDFGAKEGIAALTILYPIDFLPAA